MWKDQVIVWQDTAHKWNQFGEVTELPDIDDELYAKGIVVWKKTTLGDFVDKALSLFESGKDFLEDQNILSGAMLAIATVSLVPLHIKIIKDDDIANKFLSLIKREEAQHFILKKTFNESEFGKIESLKLLIADLVNNKVLIETNEKYIINGKVLNGVHLSDDDI